MRFGLLVSSLVISLVVAASSFAQQATGGRAIISGVTPPLRSLKAVGPEVGAAVSGEVREVPLRPLPRAEQARQKEVVSPQATDADPAVQDSAPLPNIPAPTSSFEGIRNDDNLAVFGLSVLPPDTNGDVGPNHYVQAVNILFEVFDKATGASLLGPMPISTLFVGLGTACDPNVGGLDSDGGDPIILYDHLADRWLISQFTFLGPPFHQCVAVSQTGDPTGAYFVYDFVMTNNKFNDYPKFGVWTDAYYMSDNQFNAAGTAFLGAGAFAFDRTKMLAGDPTAGFVYFDLASNGGGLLPSDLDGPAPPVGTPNYFAQFTAGEFGDPQGDALRIFEFRADFVTPANSTFTERADSPITTAAFDPIIACGGSGRDCIAQPAPAGSSAKLDAIADRLMHRLQYRNFGTHESLVTNHTVDVAASHAGVRYYEVRRTLPGGTFSINEQASFAPDGDHRWMGSAAMDKDGNLAVGYSVSSATTFPSIRYAGRLASDPPGGLFQGEAELQAGSGSQTDTASRWGDYSMMAIDPVDDCTFWYTTEYYPVSSPRGWHTGIGSFTFSTCGSVQTGADLSVTKSDSPDPAIVGNNLTYTLTIHNAGPALATGVGVTDTLPPGVTFVSSATSQGTCAGTSVVTCDLGSLANGANATVTLVVTATAAGTLTNTASVAGVEADPNTADNSATAMTTVNATASCVGTGTFTISGRVRTSAGVAISNVIVTLSGPGGCTNTATTGTNGRSSFATLAAGTYTVTPSKTGCTFTPTSRTVTISGANRLANFTGSCP